MIKLRKATLKDVKIIDNFQYKVIEFERQFDPLISKSKDARFYPIKEVKKMLRSKNNLFLLAEIDNKPVGMGFIEIKKKDSNWCIHNKLAHIGLMFVEKEYRRKGIGQQIIQELIKWANKNKIKYIKLAVYTQNQNAIEAYKKVGFKESLKRMLLCK